MYTLLLNISQHRFLNIIIHCFVHWCKLLYKSTKHIEIGNAPQALPIRRDMIHEADRRRLAQTIHTGAIFYIKFSSFVAI